MLDGLRKVVQIEVFDFDSDTMAYALDTHKNQFGYKSRTDLVDRRGNVQSTKIVNNVEKGAFYNRILGLNLSQLGSLKRKVRKLTRPGMFPFESEDKIEVVIRGGSKIIYTGKHMDEFREKVLGYRK